MLKANRKNPDLLTTRQVAKRLNIKVREVRQAIRDNRIDAFTEGGQYWIRAEHLDEIALAGEDLIRVGDYVGVQEEKKKGEYTIKRWRLGIVEAVKSLTRIKVRFIDNDEQDMVPVSRVKMQPRAAHKRTR